MILVAIIFDLLTPLPLPVIVGTPPVPSERFIKVVPLANIVKLPLERSEENALLPTTWYLKTASKVATGMSFIFVKDSADNNCVNAALVGANTVSFAVLKVEANVGSPPGAVVALVTAFTKESNPAVTAVSTMFPEGGIKTLPIT